MHILLIHQIFVTPEEGGGTRHYELARYLVEKGHRITVIASDIDYLTGKRKGKKRETKEGIDIIYSYTFQAVHKSFFYRALSFLSFAASSFINALKLKNIDIVWGTSPPLFQAFTTFLISRIKRNPFVFEVRDLWVDFAEELGIVRNPLIIKAMKFLENKLYKHSSKIIVNSPGFIPFIERHVKRGKINLIPNGVITKEFEIANNNTFNFRLKNNFNNKFIAIYLGNIGVANDIEVILRAAEELKEKGDIQFVIMGGGIKKDSFRNFIIKNNLSNISIIDSQPKSVIPGVLAEVDVCIATLRNIPLFRTTYPNKVFDYMAAQKPTVLAIDGVIREVIESSQGGIFVTPGSSSELAEAVLKYYDNPALKEQHGKNARAFVTKYYEREKIAGDLEKVFLSLVSKYQEDKT